MQKLKQGFKKIPLILVFILALVVVFSLKTKQYLTYRNLLVLLQQGSVLLIVASSATFIIISGGLDLSLGAILTLSGITAALAVTAGVPIPVVFVVGALTGAVCGLLNGWLISCCGLPPFITTLGTQGIFYGIALVLTNKEGIVIYDEAFLTIGATLNRKIPMAFLCCLVLYIIMILVQDRTRFGRYLFAIGGNEEGARISGVRVNRVKRLVYSLSGLMAAISGIAMAARLGVGQSTAGQSYEMDAIAATVIGGASLSGGSGSIVGAIIGAAIMGVLRNGLVLLDVSAYWQQTVIGAVIILAVALDNLRHMKKKA